MRPLLIVSSINHDTQIHLPTFPCSGQTLHATSLLQTLGGKGANVAIAASLSSHKTPTYFAGAVGHDTIGTHLLSQLSLFGVDVSLVETIPDVATGAAFVMVDAAGENRIIVVAGANFQYNARGPALRHALCGAVLVLQMEIRGDVVARLAKMTQAEGGLVIFNPSPVPARSAVEWGEGGWAWRHVDVIVVNEGEAAAISAAVGVAAFASVMRQRCGASVSLVVTLGERGVWYLEAASELAVVVPASNVDTVVDTTAAGDTFTGYLAAGLAAAAPFAECVEEAVVAAAMCVERVGAAVAVPRGEEVRERMRKEGRGTMGSG